MTEPENVSFVGFHLFSGHWLMCSPFAAGYYFVLQILRYENANFSSEFLVLSCILFRPLVYFVHGVEAGILLLFPAKIWAMSLALEEEISYQLNRN